MQKAIRCIHCESEEINRNSKQKCGRQRLKCKQCGKIFQDEYTNNGSKPSIKVLIIKNVSKWQRNPRHFESFRNKSKYSSCGFKKTKNIITNVNPKYLNLKKPLKIRLEMDEMWSRVYCNKTPCWLWHAINHESGDVVAYVLETREYEVLWNLLDLLITLNIEIVAVYSDHNPAYQDAISHNVLQIGKKNTQKIERKHLTFRTRLNRLARKTICYSKSFEMHEIVFGLMINSLQFDRQLF